jgi:hypothetical protein
MDEALAEYDESVRNAWRDPDDAGEGKHVLSGAQPGGRTIRKSLQRNT